MPPRRLRTNRTGSPYRSPTPNRLEDDPFVMSPETKRQRMLQEKRLKNQANAEERAKRYAKKFQNFLNNTPNYASVNSALVKDIKDPVYLLSDAMINKNAKVRHVYSREYLNKTFKNKTIHRSPLTGVSTHPNLIRNYNKRVENLNFTQFHKERKFLTKVFGKEEYARLQLKHMMGDIKPYHFTYAQIVDKYFSNYYTFLKEFEQGTRPKHLYELSATDVQKLVRLMQLLITFKNAPILLTPVRAALSVVAENNYTLSNQDRAYFLRVLENNLFKPFRALLLSALRS